jgi:hypothetical protein
LKFEIPLVENRTDFELIYVFSLFPCSEKKLNLSTIVVDTLMDEVISQLEQQQAKLVRGPNILSEKI